VRQAVKRTSAVGGEGAVVAKVGLRLCRRIGDASRPQQRNITLFQSVEGQARSAVAEGLMSDAASLPASSSGDH